MPLHAHRSKRGWLLVLVLFLLTAVTATGLAYAHPGADGRARWIQIWSDNFTGPAGPVNTQKWRYQTGRGTFGNGEIEDMTGSLRNVHLDGHGDLDITAVDQDGLWTSARIRSRRAFAPPPGGEMRVIAWLRQPDAAPGVGYWPAFWMLGLGSWPAHGEIDILEDVNALSEHSAALHCGNLTSPNPAGGFGPCHETNGLSSGMRRCAGCQTGYHSYSVIVDRRHPGHEQIRWYTDRREFFQVDEGQVGRRAWDVAIHHGFTIIFDVAIGGSYPNGVCGCVSPAPDTESGGTLQVRGVAVYRT